MRSGLRDMLFPAEENAELLALQAAAESCGSALNAGDSQATPGKWLRVYGGE